MSANPFNTYMYDCGLLERVFVRWQLVPSKESDTTSIVTLFQHPERFFVPSGQESENYFFLLKQRGYATFSSMEWSLLLWELYVEVFLVVLPYEFFWGKALFLYGMVLPFWALWAKPFIATPPFIVLLIYVIVFSLYLQYAIHPLSFDLHFIYEKGWWEFRFLCVQYIGIDPDD